MTCAICGGTYLLWADGLHHDDRSLDLWHDVKIGELEPIVDIRLLPPAMRPAGMQDMEPQRPLDRSSA